MDSGAVFRAIGGVMPLIVKTTWCSQIRIASANTTIIL